MNVAEEHIITAIRETQGQDRIVVDLESTSETLGSPFPNGTQSFAVISESADCPHTPKCKWYDHAYCYLGRIVIVAQRDLHTTSVASILRRLTVTTERDVQLNDRSVF